MGLSYPFYSPRHLVNVAQKPWLLTDIKVLADKIHIIGTVLQHALAPLAHRSHSNNFYRGIFGFHNLSETIML